MKNLKKFEGKEVKNQQNVKGGNNGHENPIFVDMGSTVFDNIASS